LGLLLLGVGLMSGYATYRSVKLKSEAAAVANRLVAAQAQLTKVSVEFAPRQKNKMLESELKNAEQDVMSLQKVTDILDKGELGNTEGYASYLKAFARQSIEGAWLTGLSIHGAGTEIGLVGRALNPELVPAYISRLKSETVMQGKSFSMLEMQVPQVPLAGMPNAVIKLVAAPYIEFNLRSTGLMKSEDAAGAKSK
jgi:hypothetical protein